MSKYQLMALLFIVSFASHALNPTNAEFDEYNQIFKEAKSEQLNDNQLLLKLDKCASAGNRHCSVGVGQIYYEKKEYSSAFPYFIKGDYKLKDNKGADYWPASFYLGPMYLKGLGVEENNEKAIKYLKRTLPIGGALNAWMLAIAYNDSVTSPVPAYAWFKVANTMGVDKELPQGQSMTVREIVKNMQDLLTLQEKADGDRLADEICVTIPMCAQSNV